MPSVQYSKTAFRALAALAPEARAKVRAVAEALAMPPGRNFDVPLRALPGIADAGLAQVPVPGAGRLVCDIGRDEVLVLSVVADSGPEGGRPGLGGRPVRREPMIMPGHAEPAESADRTQ